jgi:WD40 repeat protein
MNLSPIQKTKSKNYKIKPLNNYKRHRDFIGGLLCWGSQVITSSEDGQLLSIDLDRPQIKKRIFKLEASEDYPHSAINHIALSKDGELLAAACDDHRIRIFETTNWKLVEEIEAHDSYVSKVGFTSDYLISISKDASIKIWDLKDYSCKHKLEGHEDWVYTMAISPDEQFLFTTSNNCSTKVWDIEKGEEVAHLVDKSALVYAADGMNLLFGGTNNTEVGNRTFPATSFWSEDGLVYSCSRDIVCWDSKDWSIKWQADLSYEKIKGVVHLPQYNLLIAVSDVIYGFDPETGELQFSQKNIDSSGVCSCAVFGDDQLITGDEKGRIAIWELGELVSAGQKVSFGGDVYRPLYVKAAERIIAGSWLGGVFSIWDNRGNFIKDFKGFPADRDCKPMAIVPSSPTQILCTGEGEIKVIDVEKAEVAATIAMDKKDLRVTEAIFVNDYEAIISCTSACPRWLDMRDQSIKMIPARHNLGGVNYIIDEEHVLLQQAFYQKSDDLEDDQSNWSEHQWLIEEDDPDLLDKQAPLLLYNHKTKEIVNEWWYPKGKTKESWGSYAWPIIGGPDNKLIAASYLKEKQLYIYEVGKDAPLRKISTKRFAPGQYDSMYAVHATETHFVFRANNQLLIYDIAKHKWNPAFDISYYAKYDIDKSRNWLVSIYNSELTIWEMENWTKIHTQNLGDKMKWVLVDEQIYTYSEEKGVLAFEINE